MHLTTVWLTVACVPMFDGNVMMVAYSLTRAPWLLCECEREREVEVVVVFVWPECWLTEFHLNMSPISSQAPNSTSLFSSTHCPYGVHDSPKVQRRATKVHPMMTRVHSW